MTRIVLAHSVLISLLLLTPARADVVFEEGLEYANPDDQHLKLNLARPGDAKPGDKLPAVLCIHGGGFRAGDRKGWDAFCKTLAGRGYVAATVTYRLAPKYQFPAAIHDVKAAVQWLRASADKYHLDPGRIGAVGDSAGGHLALFLGVTGDLPRFNPPGATPASNKVQCVVSYYGPSDFTQSYGKSVDAAEVLPLWFGGDLTSHRLQHVLASPLYWVTPEAPPTLLLHGTQDKYVHPEQAQWIHERLKAAQVETQLLILDDAGHGFKGEDKSKADATALDFFDKHLKKSAP